MSSPTQLSLNKLRKDGYTVSLVEKWVPQTPAGFKGAIIRKDVWGFGDILAVKISESSVVLVQTTSKANISSRLNKIKQIPEAGIWLASGNRILVHGWAQKKGSNRWLCKEIEVSFEVIEAKIPEQQETMAL
jgi:hypothetical protein